MARAMQAVGRMLLALPPFALAAVLDGAHVRSWPALWSMLGLLGVLSLSVAGELRRMARERFSAFAPQRALVQLCTAVAVCSLSGVAFGLHGGAFLLLPVVPFIVATLIGGASMAIPAWIVLACGLLLESALELPLRSALWDTFLYGLTAAALAVVVDPVLGGALHAARRNRSLAELAAHASAFRSWPESLSMIDERLARSMDVDRFAVLGKGDSAEPFARALSWPEPDWPSWQLLGQLPERCTRTLEPATDGSLSAVAGRSGDAVVVVVTPHLSRLGSPVDTHLVDIVAASLAAIFERTRLISGLVALAHTDDLTGLANRRRLFEALEQEMARARRNRRPVSVAIVDLDHFKRYNDTFGHHAGDELLRRFASRIRRPVRAQDLVTRYGGEEFCLVLPETSPEGGLQLVDGLRSVGAGEDLLGRRVTFSAGVATWDGTETAEQLLFRADSSLYRAKAGGRDRVAAAPLVPRARLRS